MKQELVERDTLQPHRAELRAGFGIEICKACPPIPDRVTQGDDGQIPCITRGLAGPRRQERLRTREPERWRLHQESELDRPPNEFSQRVG